MAPRNVGGSPMHMDLGVISQRLASNEQAFSEFKTNTNNALQAISAQLAQTTSSLQNQLSGMASTMESRMRPQWGTMGTLAGVFLTFFVFFVISPIQRDIEGLRSAQSFEAQERVKDIKELRDNTVSWREHLQLITELRDNRAQTVTRSEHEQQWSGQRATVEHLQAEIKRLDTQISELYNAGTLLRELQQRIHELESQRAILSIPNTH